MIELLNIKFKVPYLNKIRRFFSTFQSDKTLIWQYIFREDSCQCLLLSDKFANRPDLGPNLFEEKIHCL